MKNIVLSLSLLAFIAAPAIAHADPMTTFYITDGTFASGGTFSGSFVLDTTNDDIESASILVDADGIDKTLSTGSNDGAPGFFDIFGTDEFDLVISSSITDPTLIHNYGTQTELTVNGSEDDATGANISSTPEPSGLMLLGTGLVALFGLTRRKLLSA